MFKIKRFIEEPVQISKTKNKDTRSFIRRWWACFLLVALSLIALALHLVCFLVSLLGHHSYWQQGLPFVIAWTVHLVLIAAFQRSTTQPWLAIASVIVFLAEGSVILWQWTTRLFVSQEAGHYTGLLAALLSLVVHVILPLRDPRLGSDGICRPFEKPSSDLRSPEDDFTLWDWMTARWAAPLLSIGMSRQIEAEDVWFLGYEFQHRHLHAAFSRLKGSVLARLLRANWIDIVILSLLAFVELFGNFSNPFLLQLLLHYLQRDTFDKRRAIAITIVTLVARLVTAQSAVFSLWFGRRLYERSRGEMITMLYEKTLNRQIIGETALEKTSQRDEGGSNGRMESVSEPGISLAVPIAGEQSTTEPGEAETTAHLPVEELSFSGTATEIAPIEARSGNASMVVGSSEDTPLMTQQSEITSTTKRLSFIDKIREWTRNVKKSEATAQRTPTTTGKLLNLMRSDVYEVAQRFWEIQSLVNAPFGLIISIVLSWNLLGWTVMIAIGIILIGQLLNIIMAKMMITWEKRRRSATDKRLHSCSQYIELLRHARWYGFHEHWMTGVLDARQKELHLRLITMLLKSVIIFVNQLSIRFLPVIAFAAYIKITKQELRVEIAFPALQLFAMVQNSLVDVPNLIMTLINASVAMGRVEQFMGEPDKPITVSSDGYGDKELRLVDASFAWPGLDVSVLRNINLTFQPGLNVIFGEVGSGKSALLQSILGELALQSGSVVCPDEVIGYCSQTPWLQSMTIRENILFFEPYNENRYSSVIGICQLAQDFKTFESSDLSPVGENGIGLSGGQKARVALARALYSRARVLLLDDPLSALDHDTAEKVAEAICHDAHTNQRIVVLATHRIDLCRKLADQVIELHNGSVRAAEATSGVTNTPVKPVESREPPSERFRAEQRNQKDKKFEDEEHRARGGVQAKVYWQYIKAGTLSWWMLLVLGSVALRLLILAGNWVLKMWGDAYDRPSSLWHLVSQMRIADGTRETVHRSFWERLFDDMPNPADNSQPWLQLLALFTLAQCLAELASSWTQLAVQYNAGKRLFIRTLSCISAATFRFYDVTPVGRLMNRMTSDMGVVDSNIALELEALTRLGFEWISSLVVVAFVTPAFLLISIFITIGFLVVFRSFLPASQSLRRLEMASLSPLMSNFGALVHGLVTVRAFGAQSRFQDTVIRVTDTFQRMDHFYWTVQTWLTYRFDIMSAVATCLLTLLAIYSDLSAGLTAFLLSAAARFVASTHLLCKTYGQMQLDFVSVERVIELLHIEREDPGSAKVPAIWPSSSDDITCENVTIRYAQDAPPALSNVSVRFKAGRTTALTGRTGSGKSTLAMALFAAVPRPEQGTIKIGDQDVNLADKHALRTRITFLAQEPMLFPGSLRANLDPTGEEYSDQECEAALQAVGGKNYEWTLETRIEGGGQNLSQGQRQLISIARAILRRSGIVIMDEATASIDLETSARLMELVRELLPGVTMIVIAHRKAVIEAADDVVELSKGRVVSSSSHSTT